MKIIIALTLAFSSMQALAVEKPVTKKASTEAAAKEYSKKWRARFARKEDRARRRSLKHRIAGDAMKFYINALHY